MKLKFNQLNIFDCSIGIAKQGIWLGLLRWQLRLTWGDGSCYHIFEAGFGILLGKPFVVLGATFYNFEGYGVKKETTPHACR